MTQSRYSLFVDKWSNGCGSSICAGAKKIVIARGKIPCDILMIGEAPGESENVVGRPFVGPAGKLLDDIVRQGIGSDLAIAFTNLVCCIPREDDGSGMKAAAPMDDDVEQCGTRLAEFVELCDDPVGRLKLIVCVGALSRDFHDSGYRHNIAKGYHRKIPTIDIMHPAAIIRANMVHRGLLVRRAVVQLQNAVEQYCTSPA